MPWPVQSQTMPKRSIQNETAKEYGETYQMAQDSLAKKTMMALSKEQSVPRTTEHDSQGHPNGSYVEATN
jgi:hypothetical protein